MYINFFIRNPYSQMKKINGKPKQFPLFKLILYFLSIKSTLLYRGNKHENQNGGSGHLAKISTRAWVKFVPLTKFSGYENERLFFVSIACQLAGVGVFTTAPTDKKGLYRRFFQWRNLSFGKLF